MPEMDITPYEYDGHQPADVVEVVVWEKAGRVNVVPEVVRIENAKQKVVWIAINGEIDTIKFHPNKKTPGPPPITKRGRRIEGSFPAKLHSGPHKYEFRFHPDGGNSIDYDPIAVIEY